MCKPDTLGLPVFLKYGKATFTHRKGQNARHLGAAMNFIDRLP
jgi:hypothetical protein